MFHPLGGDPSLALVLRRHDRRHDAYRILHVIGSHEPDGGASALDQPRGKP